MENKSYFDGGLLQLIGWRLLGIVITVCTLGICFPWAFCMIYNWEAIFLVFRQVYCRLFFAASYFCETCESI